MMETTIPGQAKADQAASTGGYGLLINRNFALLWSGQVISNIGDAIFSTALVLWIGAELARGVSWAPMAVAGVFVAEYLPALLVSPAAGVFVDRWPKRPTMLRMDGFRALLIGSLVTVTLLPEVVIPTPWKLIVVYVAVLMESTAAQFFNPSRFALIGDIVDGAHRDQAVSLSQAVLGLSVVIGPAIAAVLVFTVGVQWALASNALSFAISFCIVFAIRPSRPTAPLAESRHFWQELVAGLRVLVGDRTLLGVLIARLFSMLGLGTMMALAYFFLTENLRAPAELYGVLSATFGIGAIIAGAIFSLFARRINMARLLWISMLALGVVMVLLARAAAVGPAFAVAFIFGPAFAGVNVATGPLVMSAAPREYVGRVSSVLFPAESLSMIIAIIGASYVDSTILVGFRASLFGIPFGPVDTCFTAAGLITILGGAIVYLYLRGGRARQTTDDSGALPLTTPDQPRDDRPPKPRGRRSHAVA
jgi:MFS family permease